MSRTSRSGYLRIFIVTAVFSAISFVLKYTLEIPILFIPVSFLKYNPSDIPGLIIGFKFGMIPGVMVIIFRDVLYLLSGKSPFIIGVFMNTAASGVFVMTACGIYRYKRTIGGAIAGLSIATGVSTVFMLPVNYAVLRLMFPALSSKLPYFALFNIVKGVLNSVFTFIFYKKLSGILIKHDESRTKEPGWNGQTDTKQKESLDERKVEVFKSLAKLVKDNPDMKIPEELRKSWESANDHMDEYEDRIKGKK